MRGTSQLEDFVDGFGLVTTGVEYDQLVGKLKGKVTILFITHQLPKGLQVDEAVVLGKGDSRDTSGDTLRQSNEH